MINKKLAFGIIFIIFLLSATISYSFFTSQGEEVLLSPIAKYQPPKFNGDQNNNSNQTSSNEPLVEECPLNGEMMTKTQRQKWEKRRPLGVMIENHTEARPQSGLSSADIIYEAVAEGGITRFLAIFYCRDASIIGPIRSARIYFIDLLREYGNYPLYAHVGGANTPGPADALGEIRKLGWAQYNDLNQFSVPFPYFWRDYERLPGRATEHTVYSSTAKLWQYAKEKRKLTNIDENGKAWNENFVAFKFKDGANLSERGNIEKIDFGFWNNNVSDYSVVWEYDKVNNTYKRKNGGKAHIDKNNGKQLEAKNIVIVFAVESLANDGHPAGHLLYGLTGKGEALIFQDGKVIKGIWKKLDKESRMRFYDQAGKEISFVRGQIWIEILPTGNKVTY